MPNLVEQLGFEYVDQFYKSAYFKCENKIYMYGRHRAVGSIQCHVVDTTKPGTDWAIENIPDNLIDSMDTFGWPKLGYRQLEHYDPKIGKLVYYLHTHRSAMRGLKDEFINFSALPIVNLGNDLQDPRSWCKSKNYVGQVFTPTFTPFLEGMEELRSGKSHCFALNEDIAIGVAVDQGPGREYDVYYKQNAVGEVLPDDTVRISGKVAKRMHGTDLFQGRMIR